MDNNAFNDKYIHEHYSWGTLLKLLVLSWLRMTVVTRSSFRESQGNQSITQVNTQPLFTVLLIWGRKHMLKTQTCEFTAPFYCFTYLGEKTYAQYTAPFYWFTYLGDKTYAQYSNLWVTQPHFLLSYIYSGEKTYAHFTN